ncbi:MAG TPA: oligosaccharide flippase family protein [Bacteroidia bacterium]|nr:oligosaccharide flippase family protein [Bacteroidia bacterium]HNT82512.1 oligosaccharide flippase family protein [Bacteroidia bacterium]HRV52257.1 oligosaccharide flippase family protein [Bacteroidia bacterium]
MSGIRKLAGQTAIYGLSSIVGRMLNYLLVPFYTRIFSPVEYGIVSELYSYSAFLLILFTYGMETAFFNFMQKEKDNKNVYATSLSSVVFTTVILSGLMIAFSDHLASLIRYPGKGEFITWLALIIAFDAITSIPFARLRQQNKAVKFAVIKIINILLNIGFNIFFLVGCPVWVKGDHGILSQLAVTFYSPSIGVGYVFLSNVLASGFTVLLLFREYRYFTFQIDKVLLRNMFVYALPLMIAGFAGMINETLDRAIYKFIAPNPDTALRELGIYSACYKLSIIMTLFIQTFRYAAEPFFFAQHKQDNQRSVYALVMTYFVITCSVIFLAVMLYLDIIQLFIGEKFRSGLGVVPILLMANMCLGIFYNLSMWYKLTEQTQYGAYFSIFGGILTVILLFVLIPLFGYMGAAWATFITYFAMMILSYVTGQKNYPIPYKVKDDFITVVLALMCYGIAYSVQSLFHYKGVLLWVINTLFLFAYLYTIYRINLPDLKIRPSKQQATPANTYKKTD